MKAKEIMTQDPVAVTPNETVSHAAELMARHDIGLIPVVEDRSSMRLRGVITDRDIAVRHVAAKHREDCAVAEHMTSKRVDVVRPDADVHDVLGRMRHDKVRRIPVVDADHRLVGVIAQADLAVKYAGHQPAREIEVEDVIEHISEPAQPVR